MKSETLSPQTLEERRKELATAVRENPADKKSTKAYVDFIRKYVVPQMRKDAQPYSFQEYFAMTFIGALNAFERGDYAIGAVAVKRKNGKEVIVSGSNQAVSNPYLRFHAEEDVIYSLSRLENKRNVKRDRIIAIRPAPHKSEEELLITSLEPCIKCYAKITVEKPNSLWIATEDAHGGAMLNGREQKLPGMWSGRREKAGIQVITPSEDPASLYYINPNYREIASEMFESTVHYIDSTIHSSREDNSRKFFKAARRSQRKIFRKVF